MHWKEHLKENCVLVHLNQKFGTGKNLKDKNSANWYGKFIYISIIYFFFFN